MMTHSLKMAAGLAALSLAVAGCGGGKDDSDAPDANAAANEDDGDDTAHTGSAGPRLHVPGTISFFAEFAIDEDGMVANYEVNGNELPSTFEIRIATEAWAQVQDLSSDEVCAVWFELEGITNAVWAADESFWFGLDITSPMTGGHNCELFDLSGFEDADPFVHFGNPDNYDEYALGIGGPLEDEIDENLDLDEEEQDQYFGGLIRNGLLDEDRHLLNWALGFVIDPETMEPELDGDYLVPMDSADIPNGDGVNPGLFRLWHGFLYGFQ